MTGLRAWRGIYNSREKLIDFFNKHIRQYTKNGIMINTAELRKRWFQAWHNALLNPRYGYRSLKDFAEENGLRFVESCKYNTKERLLQYFEENIRKHCKNGIMLKRKELIELWFLTWYTTVSREHYWLHWVSDFAKDVWLEYTPRDMKISKKG